MSTEVLVEYDDVEWQRREWLSPHRDAVFSLFLVEKGLCWAERPDPRHTSLITINHHNHDNHTNNNHHHPHHHHHHRMNGKPLRGATAAANTVAWPALTFYPLVARVDLSEDSMPLEFMQDRRLDFCDYSELKIFTQDWELTKGSVSWANAVRRWSEMQDGQRILLTTPSVLVGFRVEVYRAEGTTQWYTAVIVGYNESTKDLTVTDDTVLEDHNEDPSLVQMRLIGDGVVESIMRGEVVGMTQRRSRSSTGLTHALVVPRAGRRPRGRPGNAAQPQPSPRTQSPVSQQLDKERGNGRSSRRRRASDCVNKEAEVTASSRQEDRENKGPPTRPGNRAPRTVLEEANKDSGSATKLRRRGGPGVKGPLESLPQRQIRRRTKPVSTELRTASSSEELEDPPVAKSPKEEELSTRLDSGKEEPEEDEEGNGESGEEDPLTKRLKTGKLKTDPKSPDTALEEEDHQRSHQQEALEGAVKEETKAGPKKVEDQEEDEESQSRERDREPEPPPPDKDPGGPPAEKEEAADPKDSSIGDPTPCDSEPLAEKAPERSSRSLRPEEEEDEEELVATSGAHRAPGVTTVTESTEDSAASIGRAASVESVELLESSSQDGSVLERLSPLVPRRRSLLLEEQERSRHNESPVILAERLNKPPPPGPGHQPQYHQQQHHHQLQAAQLQHHHQRGYPNGSPVVHQHQQHPQHYHSLAGSPHDHHAHHHHLIGGLLDGQQQHQLHHQHPGTRPGGDESGLMEMEAGAGVVPGVLAGGPSSGLRAAYGDSGSDSGVSSLRSAGSGDERSGSRSSALSAEETATPAAAAAAATTPARVWHVQSVQHASLLMAHPQGAPSAAGPSAAAAPVGYQTAAAPAHHHPAVASEMLWRPPRYPPLPHALLAPSQPSPEEMLERDRHERMLR
ncbi:probable JmjC domain-containing histone demethylation protein 2C [Orussus abietinus]|uniref:probable JmjC domain-containing histone demethylation protein 2C n=1 Tax=Orussus abietinus TaxID=222816 RepID=UPI000C715C16|nr:probable JmjC domain-containing histone demethylation protein 2C [Orussus abietinus]